MNPRFPKHLILPGIILAICLSWLISGFFRTGFFRKPVYNTSPPVYKEETSFLPEERESIAAEFTRHYANLYGSTLSSVNGSKVIRFAVTAGGEAVREGRYLWNGIRESAEKEAGADLPHRSDSGQGILNVPFTVPLGCELASVIRVVDGDTILLQPLFSNDRESSLFSLSEFTPVYVRLAGINSPESRAAEISGYASSTPEGEAASAFLKEILAEDQIIWLSTATPEDSDQYGRLLRLVWLDDPSGTDLHSEAAASETLNALLLRRGYAVPLFVGEFEFERLFSEMGPEP